MSTAVGVAMVLHVLATDDAERLRTGGVVESISPLFPDKRGFLVRAANGAVVHVTARDVVTSSTLHPGATTLAEILRAFLDMHKLGFKAGKIDYSTENVTMEVAFVVAGDDGTLNAKPTLYRVLVEKLPEPEKVEPVTEAASCARGLAYGLHEPCPDCGIILGHGEEPKR